MPFILSKSSGLVNGLPSMIFCAVAGPIPGNNSSLARVALFTSVGLAPLLKTVAQLVNSMQNNSKSQRFNCHLRLLTNPLSGGAVKGSPNFN